MSENDKREIGSALFAAQNELSDLWMVYNVEGGDERQAHIDAVQAQIIKAVKLLGGVEYLLEIGA